MIAFVSHAIHDRFGFELAKQIASGLPDNPEWIELARANLDRWSEQNRNSPGLLRCYEEWRNILNRPVSDICRVLLDPSEEGQRLRQSSPFVGVFPPAVIWEIKRRIHEETAA